jgi:hypothetical protein
MMLIFLLLACFDRYNLLLREILRRTPPDNPDYELLPKVMESITNYMQQVNTETGKCENIFNLQQLEERLSFKSSAEHVVTTGWERRRRLHDERLRPTLFI